MIVGIGCDIVRISRIAKLLQKYGDHFKSRIFTEEEVRASADLPESLQNSYYAKRFAAKEAIAKAVGTGISSSIGFLDISILNHCSGAPKAICAKLQDHKIHISLSDETDFAIAYVILEQ